MRDLRCSRTIAAVSTALACVGCGAASHGAASPHRAPARAAAALPTIVTIYDGGVRITGRLIVNFSAGPACGTTAQCDVTSGTMTWTPPSSERIEVVDLGPTRHPRLEGFLDLSGTARQSSLISVQRAGAGTCVDTVGSDESDLPMSDAGHQRVKFSLWGTQPSLTLLSVEKTPASLGYAFLASGLQVDEPAPTHCGGPLPSDVMPLIPSQRISLATLAHGRTRVDLSGTAPFSAHGLSGTVRSTIVLHVARLRGRKQQTRPRRKAPRSQDNRVITLHYQVVKVAGSVAVDAASNASTCAAYAVCGLSGTLTVRPDAVHGQADVIAYDTAESSASGLRRAVGLAPGRVPATAQVYGLATWTGATGTVSTNLARNGATACRDSARLSAGGVELDVTGATVKAVFGGPDFARLTPERDLLRTRCPGPVLQDIQSQQALASTVFPVQQLGQPTITLHLTQGIDVVGPAFIWHSRPNLTIVLRRTSVTERLVPSSYFET